MAIKTNFSFFKGEAPLFTMAAATPTPMTGWTVARIVKSAYTGSVLLAVPATITDAGAGVYTVAFTSAQTVALGSGLFYYDDWRTDVTSEVQLAYGRLEVLPSVRYGV